MQVSEGLGLCATGPRAWIGSQLSLSMPIYSLLKRPAPAYYRRAHCSSLPLVICLDACMYSAICVS